MISLPLIFCLLRLLVTVFAAIVSQYWDNFGTEGAAANGAYLVAVVSVVILYQVFLVQIRFVVRITDSIVAFLFSVDGKDTEELHRHVTVQMQEFRPNFTQDQVMRFSAEYDYNLEYAFIWILTEKPMLEKLSFTCPGHSVFKVALSDRVLYEGSDFDVALNTYRSMYPTEAEWLAQNDKLRTRNGEYVPMSIEA